MPATSDPLTQMCPPSPGRERGPGGTGALLLFILACTPHHVTPPTPDAVQPPAELILGTFADDYGETHLVRADEWVEGHGLLHIVRWDTTQHYLIAWNDSANKYDPGKWSRIDWVEFRGMAPFDWGFCLSAYDAPTADSAAATRVVHPATPRTGCNGHPYTRMRSIQVVPLAGRTSDSLALERCHQAYLTAGSDGPKLLAVDSLVPDPTRAPPVHCGQLRSAHPRLKSSE